MFSTRYAAFTFGKHAFESQIFLKQHLISEDKKKGVYSVCQVLFLFLGLSSSLVSGFIQSLLQSLTFLFRKLPVLSQLFGDLLTL